MSRIDGVPPRGAGVVTRGMYAWCKRMYGKVVEPLAVAAHHPRIAKGYSLFEWVVAQSHDVDEKLKDLAQTKAAALTGCEFCMDIASAVASKSGATREQLIDLPRHRESPHFSELERLVLDYADGMTRTPVDVPDELFEQLRERFSERQLVELTTAIAIENYRARWNWAMGIGAQGFVGEGGFCVVPEGPAQRDGAAA